MGRRTSHSWLPSLWFSRAGDDEQDDEQDDEEDDGDDDEEEECYDDHCHADHDKDSFESSSRVLLNPGQNHQRGKKWILGLLDC